MVAVRSAKAGQTARASSGGRLRFGDTFALCQSRFCLGREVKGRFGLNMVAVKSAKAGQTARASSGGRLRMDDALALCQSRFCLGRRSRVGLV